MRRRILFTLFVAPALLLGMIRVAAQDSGRARWALVIGCGAYQAPLCELPYAPKDAMEVARLLIERGDFPAENVRVMVDDCEDPQLRPTRANILMQLSTFLTQMPAKGDKVVFYFSGHGFSVGGQGYLVPVDAAYTTLQDSAIPLDRIRAYLRDTPAGLVLVILDSCLSGMAEVGAPAARAVDFAKTVVRADDQTGEREERSWVALTSCGRNEYSYPLDPSEPYSQDNRSAFTHFLLEALSGNADVAPKDGRVTVAETARYVEEAVRHWASGITPTPVLQRPVLQVVGAADSISTALTGPTGISPAAEHIWILTDTDPDYENPPFDDRLLIGDSLGNVVEATGLNICEAVGGYKAVAASPDGQYALVAENVTGVLSRYDLEGRRIWSIAGLEAVDFSARGYAYALTTSVTIHGEAIVVLDPTQGAVLRKAQYGGFDLVVDDAHDSVWLVGADVKRLGLDLSLVLTIDPIAWCAVSVDYSSDGSIWVAERDHPDVQGSKDRLLKVSQTGEVLRSVDLSFSPGCLDVDRSDDSVWVAGGEGVWQFDRDGNRVRRVGSSPAGSVRVSARDGSVWAHVFGLGVTHYGRDGTVLLSLTGPLDRQTWMDVR